VEESPAGPFHQGRPYSEISSTCTHLATAFSLSLPTHLHGRGRRGTGRRGEKVDCSRARNEERRRHWSTERLVLHFIAQYVTTCSVGRCIYPAVLGPNPRLSRPCLGQSNSAVAQFRFQLTSFSPGSPDRHRDCSVATSVGQLASQPAVLAMALMRFTERRK